MQPTAVVDNNNYLYIDKKNKRNRAKLIGFLKFKQLMAVQRNSEGYGCLSRAQRLIIIVATTQHQSAQHGMESIRAIKPNEDSDPRKNVFQFTANKLSRVRTEFNIEEGVAAV